MGNAIIRADKVMLWSCSSTRSLSVVLLWGTFHGDYTVTTDHQAVTHPYFIQDTSNMLTGWAIVLGNFDFTVTLVAEKWTEYRTHCLECLDK